MDSLRASTTAAAVAAGAMLAAGCAPPPARDAFSASGELVALSGGDAGAARACFVCHGLQGQGDARATPRLAGLPYGYLLKQLEDYATGRRQDPAMSPIAKVLDAESRRAVAAYYAGLPAATARVNAAVSADAQAERLYHRGDPERGLPACAACHGSAGEGVGAGNPPLAGQPEAYLAAQMRLWRLGKRRNDPLNLMVEISRRLTPAEAEAIARYAAEPTPRSAETAARPAASL